MRAVPTASCPYHQQFEVDRATGRAQLPACRDANRDHERKSFVVLPSNVVAWLAERNRAIPEAPVFAAGCALDVGPPVMILPSERQVVTLIPGVPAKNQVVPLQVATRAPSVSWFVDGELVGTAKASERLYWTPTVGTHQVVVIDDVGRKARRTLIVKLGASQLR
jgi:penicillin-binding protein 1C